MFTVSEWSLLKQLVDILHLFGEATGMTQQEKMVTINSVVPSVLFLNHHLEKVKPQVLVKESLTKRFLEIFINVKMASGTEDGITAPFSDPVYLKTVAFDLGFSFLDKAPSAG